MTPILGRTTWHNLLTRATTRTLLLASALWLSFVYVRHEEVGWNVNSRLCLTYALVEQGTVRIDDYWQRPDLGTRDVATIGGHFYSDKIFGTSLLGVIPLAAIRLGQRLVGVSLSPAVERWAVTAFSVALMAALAGAIFHRLARRYLLEQEEVPWRAEVMAAVTTLFTFVGTMLFLFAGVFMPYLPAIGALLVALWLTEISSNDDDVRSSTLCGIFPDSVRDFFTGLALGSAILFDYLAGWPAALIAAYTICFRRQAKAAAWLGLGVVLPLVPYALYCYAIFGSLSIPYQYELEALFRNAMSQGLMGATWPPRLTVAWLLAFHPYRGFFYHSPHLLMGFVGMVVAMRQGGLWRWRALLFCMVFWGLLLYNSAYYMWWGGWGLAPRFLALTVPFLALAALPALRWRVSHVAASLAGLWGVFVHVVMNFMPHNFPDRPHRAPLQSLLSPDLTAHHYPAMFRQYVWPKFLLGETEWSFSSLLGLRGLASLAPLLLLWLVVAALYGWSLRAEILQARNARQPTAEG